MTHASFVAVLASLLISLWPAANKYISNRPRRQLPVFINEFQYHNNGTDTLEFDRGRGTGWS